MHQARGVWLFGISFLFAGCGDKASPPVSDTALGGATSSGGASVRAGGSGGGGGAAGGASAGGSVAAGGTVAAAGALNPSGGNGGAGGAGQVACVRDQDCFDGNFCNGEEVCSPGAPGTDARGCKPALAGPCAGDTLCDEATYRCVGACPVVGAQQSLVPTIASEFSLAQEFGSNVSVALAPLDADGDGAAWDVDCDDNNPNRYPGNTEVCDLQNVDEDCNPATFGLIDQDGDGAISASCCNAQPSGGPLCGTDCDDLHSNVKPGVLETCNHVDDNCDGVVDDGVGQVGYRDQDGDGFGDPGCTRSVCGVENGYVLNANDCDDTRPAIGVGSQVCAPDGQAVLLCASPATFSRLPCPKGKVCVSQPDGTGRCE
ncbi:MAG: putative metal-binding motif-containing protein [Polyangiaceae bacterium]|nr:putative metal-binding motif-containing protein [Polyangiaceae bacterium]